MKLGGADGYDARREEEKLQVRRRKRNKEDKVKTILRVLVQITSMNGT